MKLRNVSQAHSRTAPAGGYGAVIFDMDGVVTDTARLHAAAWQALFDEALPALSDVPGEAFDPERDYRPFVDGRSREDGIRTFLGHRGIKVPEGEAGDQPGTLSVFGLAARKQQIFAALLKESGAVVFPDALALLRRLFGTMVPTGLVTASRNCRAILAAAGITELFTVVVDGTDAANLDLSGKPDPAMFLEAARRLHIRPVDAVVLEDAPAGVRAGVSGGFALVVGVDRGAGAGSLLESGANVVVNDLSALSLVRPSASAATWAPPAEEGDGPGPNDEAVDEWLLSFHGFDPAVEGRRETLCTLGNGYWATRGSVPGTYADETHYPGTYFAGVYNRAVTQLAGRVDEAEHMVNAPDWTYLSIRTIGGALLQPGLPEMLSHHQTLDLRHGVLTRTNRYRDSAGRTTRVASRQFQSMADPHLAVMETTIEAEDWAGAVEVVSAINAAVGNRNSVADSHLSGEHLVAIGGNVLDEETVLWESRTRQSGIDIALALRTSIRNAEGDPVNVIRQPLLEVGRAGFSLSFAVEPGHPVTIERTVAAVTSRDRALSTAALSAGSRIGRAPQPEALLRAHKRAWDGLWGIFGVTMGAG